MTNVMEDWKQYTQLNHPDVNSVGKCTRLCEVQLEDGSVCYAYYGIAGWYRTLSAYAEYEIKSPVRYWRYVE